MKRLAIIGGGSWGTALALALSPRFSDVRLWVHDAALAGRMETSRVNDFYLPGFDIPPQVRISHHLGVVLDQADVVVHATPSHHAREVLGQVTPHLAPAAMVVSATKGIETGSLLRMSQVLAEVCGPRPLAVLSGPSFAQEVAAGKPVALVVASDEKSVAGAVQMAFSTSALRLYVSSDVVGVELGGALKNVIAIGAGVCTGLDLGHNALAALMTRGLAEISRLAVALGGCPQTLSGLAGMGDLVLTCTGALSRNRKVGIGLASGVGIKEISASMKMVAEGVRTAAAAMDLARRCGVEMPIAEQMEALLAGHRTPVEAIRLLMERSLKDE
ncbi:MAG TPA: glycerol-3-phosphate dehydrogenase [Solibacterales bacterium]|nr:glycerol-3-phosphate dehydrogenase [Bryobacterales bacterium]